MDGTFDNDTSPEKAESTVHTSPEQVNEELTTVNQELALRASEEKYRTLFDSIDEGFCTIEVIFDHNEKPVDYRFLETNPAFVRQTGLENAAGRRMREMEPQYEEFWFETYGQIAKTGEAMRFQHEAAALGRFYDVYAFRIGEPQENRVAILFNDITDRKRAQDALCESEERFRLFVTAASVIVYRMSADWSEMLLLEGKSFLADTRDPSLTWLEEYIPDSDKPLVQATIAEAVRTKKTFELKHHVIRADGSIGWVYSRAIPFLDERGEIVEWFGAASDITERKRAEEALSESEERLRLLIETAEDYAIFTMTPDNLINYWNAGAERIFGYSDEEIIGQSGSILFTPEDRENGVPELEMRTAEEKGRAADERWHITRNGTRFYCSGVTRPLRHGRVLHGFAKIARDLTSQKRAEEELQRAHDELEERVRNRTAELLDLNQTLLTEVGERTAAEERARKLVQQIVTVQEVERANIARDLHDHLGQQLTGLRLKLQNHKASCGDDAGLSAEVEELQAIAEQLDGDLDFLAWELRPAALDEFGLQVTLANFVQEWSKHFDTPAEFHTTVLDDLPLRPEVEINLYRIAQEALNNISKHAEAARVDVLLQHRNYHVELIIEDDGKGFEPEVIEATQDGKRVGLLNMRERAASLGGRLEIESNPGTGTTVFVRVPLQTDQPTTNTERTG